MEKILKTASSFAEAEAHDTQFYKNLSVQQRLEIFLKLMEPFYAASPRLQRVYRVAELSQRPIRDDWGMGIQLTRPAKGDG